MNLDEYLRRVVFYKKRSFSPEDFKKFMFSRSQPYDDMFDLIRSLKKNYGLRVIAVSNEGRELTEYRIREFDLDSFIDAFVSSCFVHFRKPGKDIYRIALDISQASPESVVYIDDREMFVQIAGELGIRGIHHTDCASTRESFAGIGLTVLDGEIPRERAGRQSGRFNR